MKVLSEGIIFLTYLLICSGLTMGRQKKGAIFGTAAIVGLIFILQMTFLFGGWDMTLILTLLPITLYLPFSIGLYLFSHYGLFQITAVWSMGFLSVVTLKTIKKIKGIFWGLHHSELLTVVILLIAGGLMIFLVFQFLRAPFQSYMEKAKKGWLSLCVPILASFLLFSNYSSRTMDSIGLIIVLVTVFSVFLLVIRVLYSQAAAARAAQQEQEMRYRMQMQYQEYENVCRKMEAGRIYRHDMRHHLLVLGGLAKQNDMNGVLKYIENMTNRLAETEHEVYCENTTVNAVLSNYIGHAKKAHCDVTAKLCLPKEMPFQEMDICIVIANALENAINACGQIEEEKDRYIYIAVELVEHRKLIISIKNPCRGFVTFDNDEIPVSSGEEGHGIGLKSICAIAEKYHGFIQCKCQDGEFIFHAALFGIKQTEILMAGGRKKIWNGMGKKLILGVILSACMVFIIFVGTDDTLQVFSEDSEKRGIGQLLEERFWKAGWGDTWIKVEYPMIIDGMLSVKDDIASAAVEQNVENIISESKHGEEIMNQQMEICIEEMKEKFLWYVTRKYEGYVGCDITWRMLRDDEVLLSICIDGVVNVGGSVQYSRYFTWEKAGGTLLELKDLFWEESDYVSVISSEILKQMSERVKNNEGNYYIPGGIWREEDCFQKIEQDQNFYINEEDQLVIVFQEYEVAPGSMGMPEFVLDKEVLSEILRRPLVIPEMELP